MQIVLLALVGRTLAGVVPYAGPAVAPIYEHDGYGHGYGHGYGPLAYNTLGYGGKLGYGAPGAVAYGNNLAYAGYHGGVYPKTLGYGHAAGVYNHLDVDGHHDEHHDEYVSFFG